MSNQFKLQKSGFSFDFRSKRYVINFFEGKIIPRDDFIFPEQNYAESQTLIRDSAAKNVFWSLIPFLFFQDIRHFLKPYTKAFPRQIKNDLLKILKKGKYFLLSLGLLIAIGLLPILLPIYFFIIIDIRHTSMPLWKKILLGIAIILFAPIGAACLQFFIIPVSLLLLLRATLSFALSPLVLLGIPLRGLITLIKKPILAENVLGVQNILKELSEFISDKANQPQQVNSQYQHQLFDTDIAILMTQLRHLHAQFHHEIKVKERESLILVEEEQRFFSNITSLYITSGLSGQIPARNFPKGIGIAFLPIPKELWDAIKHYVKFFDEQQSNLENKVKNLKPAYACYRFTLEQHAWRNRVLTNKLAEATDPTLANIPSGPLETAIRGHLENVATKQSDDKATNHAIYDNEMRRQAFIERLFLKTYDTTQEQKIRIAPPFAAEEDAPEKEIPISVFQIYKSLLEPDPKVALENARRHPRYATFFTRVEYTENYAEIPTETHGNVIAVRNVS